MLGLTADRHEGTFKQDAITLKLGCGADVQLYKFTETHQMMYLKQVDFMIYKVELNKSCIKQNKPSYLLFRVRQSPLSNTHVSLKAYQRIMIFQKLGCSSDFENLVSTSTINMTWGLPR